MTVGKSALARLPVSLPRTRLPPDFDRVALATRLSSTLLSGSHVLGKPSTYASDASWRDVFALTGTTRTFYGPEGISAAWNDVTNDDKFGRVVERSWRVVPPATKVVSLPMGECWVEVLVEFEAEMPGHSGLRGSCTALVGVCPDDSGEWKVWVLRTILENVSGWPDVNQCRTVEDGLAATNGVENGVHTTSSFATDVLIVGAGQSGLSVAGRFEALGVKYVMIDSHPRIGDSWGKRYSSAKLHTIRAYSHLPFDKTFPPDEYSEFLHKHELSRGYVVWARKFGVDKHFRGNLKLTGGKWDEKTRSWTLTLSVCGASEQVECRCKFLVMATGGGGQIPWSPPIPGREKFKGLLMHSVDYTEPGPEWKGKKGIVVGTANTAHDVADDMLLASMSNVTMIQRSSTYVFPGKYWHSFSAHSYNEQIPTDLADKIGMSAPYAVGRLIVKSGMDAQSIPSDQDEFFDSLTRVGFKVERTGDLMWHLLERSGGHYFDMGVCAKIARGEIDIKSDSPISSYTPNGLAFEDGTELEADVIVLATGFELNLKDHIRQMLGSKVADRIDRFMGVTDEGEVRGAYRFEHPGLICHGIALGQARWFSKYVAFQIKAALEGKPFAQYKETPLPPKYVDTDMMDMEPGKTGTRG